MSMMRGNNNEKIMLLEPSEQPSTSTQLSSGVKGQKNTMKRSTSSGAASLAGALNHVRKSILRGVGGTSLNESSPKHLPNSPRKSVSFHNLVGSSSVLQFALRSLSPKRRLSSSKSTENEFNKQLDEVPVLLNNQSNNTGSLKKSLSSFVLTREFFNFFV